MRSLLMIITLTLALLDQGVLAGGYIASCSRMWVGKAFFLHAHCHSFHGSLSLSPALSLTHCIANAGGNMVWQQYGGAGQSCTDCRLVDQAGGLLGCNCLKLNRRDYHWTEIDLNAGIKNDNGVLKCDWM